MDIKEQSLINRLEWSANHNIKLCEYSILCKFEFNSRNYILRYAMSETKAAKQALMAIKLLKRSAIRKIQSLER